MHRSLGVNLKPCYDSSALANTVPASRIEDGGQPYNLLCQGDCPLLEMGVSTVHSECHAPQERKSEVDSRCFIHVAH